MNLLPYTDSLHLNIKIMNTGRSFVSNRPNNSTKLNKLSHCKQSTLQNIILNVHDV